MIELKDVSKNYGLHPALKEVSFSVKQGEIVGFVGPNGAGKSTAMKIITTYTAPTSGTVSVDGLDVLEHPQDVRRRIGYLPETSPLYADMLVHEYIEFVGRARHLNGKLKSRYEWVVQAAGLEPVLKRKIGELSKGFRQRTCLAQALIHDPEVLILDEPTSGLDPHQIIGIRKLIKDLSREKTVILSTHILPEASRLADRILMISNGRIVADGSLPDLLKRVSDANLFYLAVKADKKSVQSALKDLPGVQDLDFETGAGRGVTGVHIRTDLKIDPTDDLNDRIRSAKWTVVEFRREALSLEDSFIRLTTPKGGAA